MRRPGGQIARCEGAGGCCASPSPAGCAPRPAAAGSGQAAVLSLKGEGFARRPGCAGGLSAAEGPWRRLRARGVSLVEVLAALAVLGAVGAVLTRAWTISMGTAARSQAELTAAVLAEGKLAEVVLEGETAGEDSGDFAPEHPGYQWRCEQTPWSEDNLLREVAVTVSWTRRDLDYETTVTTLRRNEEP